MEGYIHVDVESRHELVKVYGSPELDDTNFEPREFASSRDIAEGAYRVTVTATPYDAACKYAEKCAKRLGVDWGAND